MFRKFALFFIENTKLTLVLIILLSFSGIFSYIAIPKQYNPKISLPAFFIEIPANGFSSGEVKKLITDEVENKIKEIPGVDETFGTSYENMAQIMVKFKVGQDNENAKIQLIQKLNENMFLKPLGVETPYIRSINPDDLSQLTYAITTKKTFSNTHEENIYLRSIALQVKEEIKQISGVSNIEIVGGEKNNMIIEADIKKLQEKNIPLTYLYYLLKQNTQSSYLGELKNKAETKKLVEVASLKHNKNELNNVLLSNAENPIWLGDVAKIYQGEESFQQKVQLNEKNAVFIGFGKLPETNSLIITKQIKEQLGKLHFPQDIEFHIIQDEGKEAQKATNTLMKDLFESILIVILILVVFLGRKNALNTATSIPLILSGVFFYSYIVGYDINRISLFALILVIGMLVDDSIVVVENIHRHLSQREKNGKTKKEAILQAVQEVGSGVILSTITKILSFVGMFFVTGMMGEYMAPIPKFAIVSLFISIFIAFSINPWISYYMKEEAHTIKKKKNFFDIRIGYEKMMQYFLVTSEVGNKRRKYFKIIFWISLLLVIILPISMNIFKARMLPKSNKDQVYLWVDLPRGNDTNSFGEIQNEIQNFFFSKELPQELQITKNISYTIGTPHINDFANLFRGGANRSHTHEMSIKIHLEEENKNRIKSEDFTKKIRPLLQKNLQTKYPNLQLRLLEDPPGPPVRATFMMKIQGEEGDEKRKFFDEIYKTIRHIEKKYDLVDIGTSISTPQQKIRFEINQTKIQDQGFTTQEIKDFLSLYFGQTPIQTYKAPENKENTQIILNISPDQRNSQEILESLYIENKKGEKIFLKSLGNFEYDFVDDIVYTDNKKNTSYIWSEMGDNSVIYPIIALYGAFENLSGFKKIHSDFYEISFQSQSTGKIYTVAWDGEWKITMDTFRDLGSAMIVALLLIYFLLVGQFKSFSIAGIIMFPFLLGFYGIFPGFSILYLIKNEYFNATSMIGVISLAGIVVGNAILLIDYLDTLKKDGWSLDKALLRAGYVRFMPIMLTSISAIFGAIKITTDPVWSGLARSIVFGLSMSAILTLIVIPIFYYESQQKMWQ